jgi:lipopolysaccharide transport system permease protein
MITHSILADVLNRAPTLILSNSNYVKKVVFPLESLSVVILGSSLFHGLVSTSVLLVVQLLHNGFLPWTSIFLPVILLPLLIAAVGSAWFLSSLGVFVRDLGQIIGVVTSVLLFLSPVFYPIAAVPEKYRAIMSINPLTFIIEQMRNVTIWGVAPDWFGLAVYTLVASVFCWLCFFWFQKTRKGFADVI